MTVLEFLKLFNIDFVIHNPRQSVLPGKVGLFWCLWSCFTADDLSVTFEICFLRRFHQRRSEHRWTCWRTDTSVFHGSWSTRKTFRSWQKRWRGEYEMKTFGNIPSNVSVFVSNKSSLHPKVEDENAGPRQTSKDGQQGFVGGVERFLRERGEFS